MRAVKHRPISPPQFSIATALLATTLVAICLAAMRISTFVGVVVVLLVMPSLVRTVIVGRARNEFGEQLTVYAKIELFGESIAVSMLAYVAAIAASMVMMCVAELSVMLIFHSDSLGSAVLGIILSTIAVVSVVAAFAYVFWRCTFPVRP